MPEKLSPMPERPNPASASKPAEEDPEVVVVPSALETVSRAEVSIQMEFARRYPRSLVSFKRTAMELATENEAVAKTMFYALPRNGKTIEGPSVRLAEIVVNAWQHMRVATRDLDTEEKTVRVQSLCWDLQRNVAVSIEAARRITDRSGVRYNEDMIAMTQAACRSVAFRNSVFKVVPFSHVKDVYDRAKLVAIGESLTMDQRRQKVIDEFVKLGAKNAQQVCQIVGKTSPGDLTLDDVVALVGLKNAIDDGDTTLGRALEQVFGQPTVVTGVSLDAMLKATVVEDNAKEGGEKRKQ